jgi:hypothetical protein
MAERMSTSTRMDRARKLGRITRGVNSIRKRKGRAAKEKRMKSLIAKGTYPYTPVIMSWLSETLGKPSTQITADEAKAAAK